MSLNFRYQDRIGLVATMHQKEEALKPSFETLLGLKLIRREINTDLLGTFTGEIERVLSPYDTLKEKCRRAFSLEEGIDICIASEGSFGPHPLIPFMALDHEMLLFIDRKEGVELTLSKEFTKTNYRQKIISEWEEALLFGEEALFPSHALIISSNQPIDLPTFYKGIQSVESLKKHFLECSLQSRDKKVLIETDMRAHMNPTRMKMIRELAFDMANRLQVECPSCKAPGWGVVRKEKGLPCEWCSSPTVLIQADIYGCCRCSYEEVSHYREEASPQYCNFCNP